MNKEKTINEIKDIETFSEYNLNCTDVSQIMNRKISTIQMWVRTGQLQAIKVKREYKFREKDVNDFICRNVR